MGDRFQPFGSALADTLKPMLSPISILKQVDRQAIRDCTPIFIPAIPFGFVLGLAITEGDLPTAVGWSSSPLVFAGAAQLTIVTLAGTASLWAVIVAGFVVNTRHVMYSAALSPTFRKQPRWMRWFGPFLLLDQTFALVSLKTDMEPAAFRRYYLTVGGFFYVTWQIITLIGMAVGPVIPDEWRLDFAVPIMFMGLVLFGINRMPAGVAAIVGGLVGLAAVGMQDRLGILVGALAGVLAGSIADSVETRRAGAGRSIANPAP